MTSFSVLYNSTQKIYTKAYSLPSVGPGADPGVRCTDSQPASDILSHPGGRLPLLFARPAVTFPAEKHHVPLTILVTERWA